MSDHDHDEDRDRRPEPYPDVEAAAHAASHDPSEFNRRFEGLRAAGRPLVRKQAK